MRNVARQRNKITTWKNIFEGTGGFSVKNTHSHSFPLLIGVSVNTGWICTACSNLMSLLSPIHEISVGFEWTAQQTESHLSRQLKSSLC